MKQITFTFSLLLGFLLLSLNAVAQTGPCVVDTTVGNAPRPYPSILPDATGCEYYETDVTLPFPRDTFALGQFVTFDIYTIDSIAGLPPGFSWECNNAPSCQYDVTQGNPAPDTLGCIKIFGTTNLATTYTFTIFLSVQTSSFGTFPGQLTGSLTVTPCPVTSDCFALNFDSNCEPATLFSTNLIGVVGNPGVTYSWDFGNGYVTSDPNPVPQTYDAGTYTITERVIVDTLGYFLGGATIDNYNCTELLGNGGPDLYWKLIAPDGTVLVDTEPNPLNDAPAAPISTGIAGLPLDQIGLYSFEVWDDDGIDIIPTADDACSDDTQGGNPVLFFSIPAPAGISTQTNDGLTVSFNILHPVDTIDCQESFTIEALPAKPNIVPVGDTIFCDGESVQLVTTSVDSIEWWKNGSPIFGANDEIYEATTAGTYTVVVVNGNNCRNESAPIQVIVNSTPEPNITLINTSLSTNAVGVTFQWYYNDQPIPGATSQTYEATQTGSYYIEVTDLSTGCSNESDEVEVTVGTGIEDLLNVVEDVKVFPNPVQEALFVEMDLLQMQNVEIVIKDVYGREIQRMSYEGQNGAFKAELNTKSLAAGAYFCDILLEEGTITRKLIK